MMPAWREPIGDCLGTGGFASVWELGGGRVLKLAHTAHDLARARMAREAEALRAIGAPAVPELHATGVLDDGRPWIVMDRIEGTSVADLIAAGPPRDAAAIGIMTLDALERIHAAGFVHRDLKPDNLVRSPDGRVVILDLGLARKLPDDPDDPTRAGVQVGSLEYMPPEQFVNSRAVDARSDLYAFGCVLYELYAGRPPFIGDAAALERAHEALRPPRLGALVGVPATVEALCHDCLAKQPARRPKSAAEASARLSVMRDESSIARTPHSMSVIRGGKQPVVLLWAELPRVDRSVLGMLTARRLVMVSQRGRRVLAGLLGGEHTDPAATAIAAARDLAAAGARVALHLDALRVGTATGATTLSGISVEQPETWLPATPWSGVVLTRALASVTQAATRDSSVGPEFRALTDEQAATELVGRDALLTDLVADAAAALHSDRSGTSPAGGPAFALLVGDAGVGKTAVAGELARRIADLGARVHVGTVLPPGTGRSSGGALKDLIGTPDAGSIVRSIGDALRASARAQPTAVIIDDLHFADHELLDALEYATLGGEPLPLWILGIASPRIDARRPQLGSRAERRRRDLLPPLEEDAAVALTAALLRPAEYPPLRALRRLVAIAHGNPMHLAILTREIHERGAVRARSGGAHFLDTGALDELSPAALGPWLAARALSGLAPELVALGRICAVLCGDTGDVRRAELVAIVEAVERLGGATTTIDVDIGLAELVRAGVILATDHGHQFRQTLVAEGIYATTDEQERLVLHRAALDYWKSQTASNADRMARHAEAVGNHKLAADAFARLGRRALRMHRVFEADEAWSGALRHLEARDADRARALLGRGQARYALQRMSEALVDLGEAAAIAVAVEDLPLEVEALLEQATVCDYTDGMSGDFARSKPLAERARARLGAAAVHHPELALDLDLADARVLFREQRFDEAVPLLRRVFDAARAIGKYQTATIAASLLGPALADRRQLDDAERVFAEMIEACTARDDRFGLTVAYVNRTWLWTARGDLVRIEEDLGRVIQLARESGLASLERAATHNLGEHRLWCNELDEALLLARRGLALQTRSGAGLTRIDRLLLARVLAARGSRNELGEVLATFDGDDGLGEEDQMTLDVLRAVAGDDHTALRDAMGRTASAFLQLRLELGALAARLVGLADGQREELCALARTDPVWSRRSAEFHAPSPT